jgi:A/G-specific adenine glycosylase
LFMALGSVDSRMRVAVPIAQEKKGGARRPGPADAEVSRNARDEAAALLAWYDRNRRILPWRAPPGERPDPYRVWLSEIMLQQTTVKTVAPYFARFVVRWPNVRALAQAPREDVLRLWAGLGYYARARNLHACARLIVERHGGHLPASESELAALPGIGPYTAGAIAAIAFGARAAAVDGNAERVLARMFAVEAELPSCKPTLRRLAHDMVPAARSGDFAQALMDLGALICTPKKPACMLCPWAPSCRAHQRGDPHTFPRRAPRREGELRRGAAFVLMRADGSILVRRRPAHGLLGGMDEVPGTEWVQSFDDRSALHQAPRLRGAKLQWRRLPGHVAHVFTHFPLRLTVYAARIDGNAPAPRGARWVARAALAGEALPSLMRKVIAHALRCAPIRPSGTRAPVAI